MKIVVKKPGEFPEVQDIPDNEEEALNALQTIVGGYVEMVHPFSNRSDLVLITDDEGKLKQGYEPNIVLTALDGKVYDYCVGTVAVVGLKKDAEGELVFGSIGDNRIPFVKYWLDVRGIQEAKQ